MVDLPVELSEGLGEQLSHILDVEGKIPRAIEALGPVAGRDVLLLDRTHGLRARQLHDLGARVTLVQDPSAGFGVPDDSADVVVSFWSSFRGAAAGELAEAERTLRASGRLLVVHDYGRDDVSHLRGAQPDYGAWSRRNGPFLKSGFKVHVVHCFWTFDSMPDCVEFLGAAFGDAGRMVAAGLKRPRLSYNVAIYHRTFGAERSDGDPVELPAAGRRSLDLPVTASPPASAKAAV